MVKKTKGSPTPSSPGSKQSYASIVTPGKEAQGKSSFFSLETGIKSVTDRMKKEKKKVITSKGDNEDVTPGEEKASTQNPDGNDDLKDKDPSTKGTSQQDTRRSKHQFDLDFGYLLEELFDEVDLDDDKPHEILQGLSMHGIKSWNSFIFNPYI